MALRHASPGEVVDLRPLGQRLEQARTSALVRTPAFEAIRLVLPAGTRIPPHKVDGPLTLHCLEGRIRLGLGGEAVEMRAGDWLHLEGGRLHDLEGLEPSSLLLTILFVAR